MSFGALLTKMTRKFSRMRRKIWDCHWSGTVCAALWLRNLPAVILMLIFGAAHLTVSIQSFSAPGA